jgi:hypothetical protein
MPSGYMSDCWYLPKDPNGWRYMRDEGGGWWSLSPGGEVLPLQDAIARSDNHADRIWHRPTYQPKPRPAGETAALIRKGLSEATKPQEHDPHRPTCFR